MITLDQGIVIAQRYTLVRPLAKGGMGSVWIARHRDLEIDVTVKFMAPSLVAEAEARMRFEREAKVAARLRSQHVVQVHDYGVEDETPYIIMELLKGESLATRVEREGRLSPPVMARLLIQICKALRTAHEAGLVHRDLKPGNVFLALKDDDEVVKVLDFGIAKTGTIGEAQADTGSGVLLGSVHYMSPEQIRSSRNVDHRSDLWSAAVIIYRVLTGRLPFPGANLGDVLVRVCTDSAPLASLAAPELSPRFDRFFDRALARDADQRFQSAPELAEAFAAIALDPPARAPEIAPSPAKAPQEIAPAPPAPTPLAAQPATLPPAPLTPAPTPFAAPPAPVPARPPFASQPTPPAPAPFVPAPQLKLTMRMDSSPLAPMLAPATLQVASSAQPAQWAPPAATPPFIQAVPAPGSGPIQAPTAPLPAIDSAPRALAPVAADRASGRPSWPIWAIGATVALAVILGVALRSRGAPTTVEATPSPSAALPTATVEAAPSIAPTAPVVAATTSASASATPTTGPRAPASSARPSTAASAPPRGGQKTKINPLDRSD